MDLCREQIIMLQPVLPWTPGLLDKKMRLQCTGTGAKDSWIHIQRQRAFQFRPGTTEQADLSFLPSPSPVCKSLLPKWRKHSFLAFYTDWWWGQRWSLVTPWLCSACWVNFQLDSQGHLHKSTVRMIYFSLYGLLGEAFINEGSLAYPCPEFSLPTVTCSDISVDISRGISIVPRKSHFYANGLLCQRSSLCVPLSILHVSTVLLGVHNHFSTYNEPGLCRTHPQHTHNDSGYDYPFPFT